MLLIFSLNTWAQQTEPKALSTLEPGVQVRQEFLRAYNAKDVDAVVALYAEDATLVSDGGTFKGRDEIRKWVKSGLDQGSTLEAIEPRTEKSSGNLAYGTGRTRRLVGSVVHLGQYLIVMEKIGGEWKIVQHFSLNAVLSPQQDYQVWQAFVHDLRSDQLTEDHLRPLYMTKPVMQQFLQTMRATANWREWEATPEVQHRDDTVYYILPLTFNGQKKTYCFTFVTSQGNWHLQHFESIVLRLDKIGSPPISVFPDAEDSQKQWMREEIAVSEQVRLFNWLVQEKGRQTALDWFRDGPGYAVSAVTWVPLVPVPRAFILYLCWEQMRLRGSRVTLERLEETSAVVSLEPIYLRLYAQTGHLREQISKEDFRAIFDTVWQDRATAAGWRLDMKCEETRCILSFTRPVSNVGP